MPGRLGTVEIIVIAIILLLFFGGKKIPEFSRGIGEAIHEFRRKSQEDKSDSSEAEN